MAMKDPLDAAFEAAPRRNFMPDEEKDSAGMDEAQSIGYGQTISQPSTVREMLEWLAIEPGDAVLDVGSGSGWTTALLSHLVTDKGHVYATELIPELLAFGKQNCERLGLKNVSFYQAGKHLGLPEKGPFDRILVGAAAEELPTELLDELRPGGKMVVPVHGSILEIDKHTNAVLDITDHPGYIFVPLIIRSYD